LEAGIRAKVTSLIYARNTVALEKAVFAAIRGKFLNWPAN